MSENSAALWRTERWFITRGTPQLIAAYGFPQVVSRMLPFLVFSLLLWLDMYADLHPWLVLGLAAAAAALTWALVTGGGRRPPPRLPRWLCAAVLAGHVLGPPLLAYLLAARGLIRFKLDILGQVYVSLPENATEAEVFAALRLVTVSWIAADALLIAAGYLVASHGLVALTLRALRHAYQDLRQGLRLQGRALPVLLFATVFLFFTNELWQVANRIGAGRLALLIGVFALVSVLAVATRLAPELDRLQHGLAPDTLRTACAGTPLAAAAAQLTGPLRPAPLRRSQRVNVLFVLATRQLVRGAVVAGGLFVLLVLLGLVVVYPSIARQWIDADVAYAGWLPGVPLAMVKLAALIAGFGGMSFVVNSMSDAEDRTEFFTPSVTELERLLAVHTAYLALRREPVTAAAPGAGTAPLPH